MIKLSTLLRESTQWKDITIQDVEGRLSNKGWDRGNSAHLKTIIHFYYDEVDKENQQAIMGYLALLNDVGRKTIELTSQFPYVEVNTIKDYLLSQDEFKDKIEDFFPMPVYVAANKSEDGDYATIGVMIDLQGKVLEIHEGHDEATPETINMVNKMVNPHGKRVRIYASHTNDLVQQIEISGYLPKGIYVSPDRGHATSYNDLQGKRSVFTGIIDINYVNQESDLDWRTLDKTKIEKFRWL